ncbi:MAG TPA: zinc-binding dehydrogenase [Opitutus sp.]|nr:zinc-binding dehydrogenase [Opitutus sp.]
MRAVRLTGINQLEIADLPAPEPRPGEVVVEIRAAALNHRDVWIKAGQYAGLKFPCIPGSDGAGVITRVGYGVEAEWLGREVVINPSFDFGTNERAQGTGFSILGLPRDGTLAEQVAVPLEQVSVKPPHLSWAGAAALPLGGLTAWRAVATRAAVRRGERVLVTGIGGGVAVFALQFAVAFGAEVWVTSSSQQKIERARTLGAKGGANYTDAEWAKRLAAEAGAFDAIVDSAGGPGFESLVDLAAPGGRLVFFGATRGNPSVLPMRKVFWRQLSLLGTTMGSPADWRAMTEHVAQHRVEPVISEVLPFDRAADAFGLMERGGQFGKIVLQLK